MIDEQVELISLDELRVLEMYKHCDVALSTTSANSVVVYEIVLFQIRPTPTT